MFVELYGTIESERELKSSIRNNYVAKCAGGYKVRGVRG